MFFLVFRDSGWVLRPLFKSCYPQQGPSSMTPKTLVVPGTTHCFGCTCQASYREIMWGSHLTCLEREKEKKGQTTKHAGDCPRIISGFSDNSHTSVGLGNTQKKKQKQLFDPPPSSPGTIPLKCFCLAFFVPEFLLPPHIYIYIYML